MAKQQDNRTRDAILALFLLGAAAETAFSEAIYAAQMASAELAYAAAADALGADASDATLPDDVLTAMAQASQDSAASIVATYNESITAEAERFAAGYHGDALSAALTDDLAGWADARAAWKADQIASYETSLGYSHGIGTMVDDLLSGDLTLPDGTALTDVVVTIAPDASSSDFCADYAGNSYPLSEAVDVIDLFPAHAGCIHYAVVDFAS